jgi:hypothetical protein
MSLYLLKLLGQKVRTWLSPSFLYVLADKRHSLLRYANCLNRDPIRNLPILPAKLLTCPGFPVCSALSGTIDIEAAPRAVVDNTFDLHHMTYVHASSFGGGELIRTWKPDPMTICFE